VIRLPKELSGVDYGFVFLSSIMHEFVGDLFTGMNVLGCYQFRVTRNSDLFVDDEEVKNLRTALQGELPQRHFGDAVRLEIADNCSPAMAEFLLQQFGLDPSDLYRVPGIVNLVRLMSVPDKVDRPDLLYTPFQPGLPKVLTKRYDIFASIRKQDILIHHPFPGLQSGNPAAAAGSRRSTGDCDQDDRVSHRHRLGIDGAPAARCRTGQGSHRRGGTHGTLRRGSQPVDRGPARRSRRPCGLRRGRLQDPRQDADGPAPRRPRATGATSISAPATTIRAPRASIPTSACSPRIPKSAMTSMKCSSSSPAWARPRR
jgi:hypothetical protein